MNPREFADRYHELTHLFLQKFGAEAQDGNLVFSPFSILSLLSILADMTGGSTRQEILNLLYGGLRQQGFSAQLKTAREELMRKEEDCDWINHDEEPQYEKPIRDHSSHLHTANIVCLREDLRDSIHPGFGKFLKDTYDGVLFSSPELKDVLLASLSEMMNDDLRPLVEEIVNSGSLLAAANTVCFDAMWKYPYEDENIKMGFFHNADHTESKVFMLHNGGGDYVENDLSTGFVKRFQQCDYSFMALLPREDGPDALRAVMDTVNIFDLRHHQRDVILHSVFPEFEVSFKKSLTQIIESLGIQEVFTNYADFSSISTVPLMADQMIHQAKIEVDRNGARASAATALISCGSAYRPKEHKYVIIDRPFIFAILNNKLGLPVFVGAVNHMKDVSEKP